LRWSRLRTSGARRHHGLRHFGPRRQLLEAQVGRQSLDLNPSCGEDEVAILVIDGCAHAACRAARWHLQHARPMLALGIQPRCAKRVLLDHRQTGTGLLPRQAACGHGLRLFLDMQIQRPRPQIALALKKPGPSQTPRGCSPRAVGGLAGNWCQVRNRSSVVSRQFAWNDTATSASSAPHLTPWQPRQVGRSVVQATDPRARRLPDRDPTAP